METKICSKCKVEKDICEFSRKKSNHPNTRSECKECNKIEGKKYRENNKEKTLNRSKKYREDNKETLKENYKKNTKKLQQYRNINKNYYKDYNKTYYENNLSKIIEYKRNHNKKRRHSNPTYNFICNIRGRVNHYLKLKNITKENKTFDIVGCSPKSLKEHIEKKFTEGMSWGLVGKYIHIDHIIPLSSAKTKEEIYKLCHYTNLQPLWAKDNLAKSNKLDYLYVMDNPKL